MLAAELRTVTRTASFRVEPRSPHGWTWLLIVALSSLAVGCGSATDNPYVDKFTNIDPEWAVTADEGYEWALVKSANLPAMNGSPEWVNYTTFLEEGLREFGVVDMHRNSWMYDRWHTTKDSSGWSLVSDGTPVRVAHYAANSGNTGPEGITAEMIYYDHDNPPDSIAGKIVVIPTRPHPEPPYDDEYIINFTFNDYEWRANDDTYWELFEFVPPEFSITFDIWWQLRQSLWRIAVDGGAAGHVIVYDMAFERTEGLYTFGVPPLHESPGVILSSEDGAKVLEDAKAGKTATLRLEATIEETEAFQTISYLPGRDYGTADDEQVLLINHADGPSITQDNGALGLLAIVKYFSHIPQEHRPRTLAVFLDSRHYYPGAEGASYDVSWLTRNPEAREPLVAILQAEHMGEMDYREVDGVVEPVGLAEQSYLWSRNNQVLIDAAVAAAKEHGWERVQVAVPERPGINGGIQQVWWGVGSRALPLREGQRDFAAHQLDLPGYGLGGFLGLYWTTASGIERWNKELFENQAYTMTQLAGVLMTADLDEIRPEPTE
ncbi:MAG TPA: hypothetical protein QGG47_00415 [Acidobacteriota bacterium]|nr:hypothetical protein [Acidobacteriota bacterium]